MSEIEDYTNANRVVTPEEWLTRSGVFKSEEPITKTELLRLLTAYRGYIYEAEMRPEIQYHGQEEQVEEL